MQEPVPGKTILIPEDPQLMAEKIEPQNMAASSQEQSTENVGSDEGDSTEETPKNEEQSSGKNGTTK